MLIDVFICWFNVAFFSASCPVCTQLLVSRSDEDNISSYLQLIDKCLIHEVPAHSGLALVHVSVCSRNTFGALRLVCGELFHNQSVREELRGHIQ